MASRSSEMLHGIPPATLGIVGLCSLVYACQLIFDLDMRQYTMNPRAVVYLSEYYRFLSSCVFHGSLMHIGINMMSASAVGTMLEKKIGTLKHAFTIAWAMLLTSSIYTLIALFLSAVLHRDGLMYQHSVGFSGVLFHLTVMECHLMPHRTRNVFGFFSVPSYLYPWALLFALQVIMSNLSFVGHLAGIISGTLQSLGALDGLFVSDAYLQEMEKWTVLQRLTSLPSFVATPLIEPGAPTRESVSLQRSLGNGLRIVYTFLGNVLETLVVCIFGRGRNANENIQLGGLPWFTTRPNAVSDTTVVGDFEEDDDWVGLPPMPENTERDIDSSRIV